jgi:hypothetical protein
MAVTCSKTDEAETGGDDCSTPGTCCKDDVVKIPLQESATLLPVWQSQQSLGYQSFPLDESDSAAFHHHYHHHHRDSRRPLDEQSSFLWSAWDRYNDHLDKSPLLVKSITAFILMGLADACAQACQGLVFLYETSTTTTTSSVVVVSSSPQQGLLLSSWDWQRTLRFGMFGLLGAPWSHYFYHNLDTALPPTSNPWTWTTIGKVVLDQFVQAPLLLAVMIVGLNVMEGSSWHVIQQDLKDRYWISLLANCKWKSKSKIEIIAQYLLDGRVGTCLSPSSFLSVIIAIREALATSIFCELGFCKAESSSFICQCGILSLDHYPFFYLVSKTRTISYERMMSIIAFSSSIRDCGCT